MQKTKCYLAALVSGVLLVTGILAGCAVEQIGDTTLSSVWIAAMSNGQQPSAPEDYIEVEK